MAKRYGVFNSRADDFVSIGTFDSDIDANIAISEHGLDMEMGEEYYVAPIIECMVGLTLTYEPGEE